MSTDKRSKIFVFVPFCLMCQAFQAKGIVKSEYSETLKPIMELLLDSNVNIIQMPCPESSFCGFDKGLNRKPAGLKRYSTPEYIDHCSALCTNVVQQIKAIINSGYVIKVVLGIENSASCAVEHVYTNQGLVKRSGIFIGVLQEELKREEILIQFLGINRRGIKKAILKINSLLEQNTGNEK